MPAGPLPLARRTTLTLGVAGIAVVASCAEHTAEPGTGPGAAEDPDAALVDGVLAELADAWQLATVGRFPELASLHLAHIEALDGPAPDSQPGRATKDAVRKREKQLQAQLGDAAMAADSGALARLLASMSAAVGQRLATLPRSAG